MILIWMVILDDFDLDGDFGWFLDDLDLDDDFGWFRLDDFLPSIHLLEKKSHGFELKSAFFI